jgi:hypothetical protein
MTNAQNTQTSSRFSRSRRYLLPGVVVLSLGLGAAGTALGIYSCTEDDGGKQEVYSTKTTESTSAPESNLECAVTREQFERAIGNKDDLKSLVDGFSNAYSNVTPDKAEKPTARLSRENALRYLVQLVDGELTPADKTRGMSANPELVSIKSGMEGPWPTITVEYEIKNSAGQTVSMTNADAQKFYFDAQAGKLYLIRFCQIANN